MHDNISFVEKCLSSQEVFSGRLLHVFKDTVRLPDGSESTREYIKHPGAAVVIPYCGDRRILMIRQYRYPVGQTLLELPAGKIDGQDSPDATIKRELAEETGYRPGIIIPIGLIHTCVGYSSERLYLYWAEQLQYAPLTADDDENIVTLEVPITDAMQMVYAGQITDAKTLIGLFWAEKIINRQALLGQAKL